MTSPAWLCLGAFALAAEMAVGVAPLDALGLSDEEAGELRSIIERRLAEERRGVELVPAGDVDRAIEGLELAPPELGTCLREGTCAATVSRAAGADQLVLASAAALGRTYVVRLALLDAGRQVVDREVRSTVVGGIEDLREALPEQVDRLFPPTVAPWYSRWWVWTLVGVGLAAAATAVTLAVLLPVQDDLPIFPLP